MASTSYHRILGMSQGSIESSGILQEATANLQAWPRAGELEQET